MTATPTTAAAPGRCPREVWVSIRGTNRSRPAACKNRATVPVHWGPERTMVCEPCADELTRHDYLIQVCRLPNGADIAPLTDADRELVKATCSRIAGPRGVRFTEATRGITATIPHWARQTSALRALRKQGFQALQPSDNPTVRIVARRIQAA
jgi:hypothetical protein